MKPTDDQIRAFGAMLREICARRGLGTRATARHLNVTPSAISYLFKPRANPDPLSSERVRKIADQLGCTNDEYQELMAAIGYAPVPSQDESEAIAALMDKYIPRRKHNVRKALAAILSEYTVQPRPKLEAR